MADAGSTTPTYPPGESPVTGLGIIDAGPSAAAISRAQAPQGPVRDDGGGRGARAKRRRPVDGVDVTADAVRDHAPRDGRRRQRRPGSSSPRPTAARRTARARAKDRRMNGASPPYSPSSDMDVDEDDEDADAEGEEDEDEAAAVTATPPDLPTPVAVRSQVYDRQSPGTIDGLDSAQLSKLNDRFRSLAVERKRGGDRRMRDPGQEEQERSIVEQTDALLLFTFCFVCLDRASLRDGRPKIHADQWKSLEALIDFVKDRAKRKGFEIPWALCCLVEAVMSHMLAKHERQNLLRLPAVAAASSALNHRRNPSTNGVATTNGDKDSPESASTSTSSSDQASTSDATALFLNLANWESRSQRSFSEACGLLSTHFVRTYLPDTARLCADLESRTEDAPTWLPHSPWWFCWPLNPFDCASDVCGFGRAVLDEYAGERLAISFPAVELFPE